MSMLPTFPSSHLATSFCFTPKQASKKGYSHDLDNLPAGDWADVNKPASIHVSQKVTLPADASLKKWVKTFKNVGKTETHGASAVYAFRVAAYLETDEAKEVYKEAYQLECSNKTLKRRAETVSANTRKILKLKEVQRLNQEEKDSIAVSPIAHHDAGSSSASSLAGFSSATPSKIGHYSSTWSLTNTIPTAYLRSSTPPAHNQKYPRQIAIKKKLFNEAKALHERYTNNEPITNMELKRMSLGLCGILDLTHDDQAGVLGREDYGYLKRKYTASYGVKILRDSPFRWSDVVTGVKSTGMKQGRKYLTIQQFLCAEDALSESQYRQLKMYDTILDTIRNRQHVLNPKTRLTEGDYTYQVWLPLFMKLFDINGDESNVRLKASESVADASTLKKSEIYDDCSNIIGFKIDIRCLYDLPNQEADICAVEVCLPSADESKFLGDISKLLREGRLNTTSLVPLSRRGANDKYTWICQVCGLQAFFSTVTEM